jgi:hypothetical protein
MQTCGRQVWVWVVGLLMLAPAAFAAAPVQTLLPSGALSTSGNQIVDVNAKPVRLTCIHPG